MIEKIAEKYNLEIWKCKWKNKKTLKTNQKTMELDKILQQIEKENYTISNIKKCEDKIIIQLEGE